MPIELMRIDKLPNGVHGKLNAMYEATAHLTEGSVLMVDADCRVGPRWIATLTVKRTGWNGRSGFEIGESSSFWRELLADDQGAITFSAMV